MALETRLLGRTGIRAPRLGLGCVTFGREIDEETSFSLMDYAVEQGITLFDTAEVYGGGQARASRKRELGIDDQREVSGEFHSSEKIIGRWLRSRGGRDRIVLVSKILNGFRTGPLLEALHRSLERLQTDFIDVYLFHRFDPDTPLEESLTAMHEARQSGLIRAAGSSNFSAEQLRQALEVSARCGIGRLEATETVYNLIDREAQDGILPLCREQELGFFGYGPLAGGFLTGKYSRDSKAVLPGTRFDIVPDYKDLYFQEEKFRSAEKLQAIAAGAGVPPAQLATAWALSHPDVTTVLVGARSTAHLDDAIAAAGLAASGTLPALE